jgi:predicted RNase H-like nuclease
MTGKQPLDGGANFIARTAHAALVLLEGVRELTGASIPTALDPALESGVQAIEVYPGATLAAYGIDAPGYKRRAGIDARLALLGFLRDHLTLPDDTSLMEANGDALDAALCILAGADFLLGRCAGPENLEVSRKEGWIWVPAKATK